MLIAVYDDDVLTVTSNPLQKAIINTKNINKQNETYFLNDATLL